MLNRRAVRGWRQMLVNQGWKPTLQSAGQHMLRRIRPVSPQSSDETWQSTTIHAFDEQYGTDTSGLIWGEDLSSGSPNDAWITGYYGIAPSVFHRMMRGLPEDLSSYTFLDLGSGKGRALMLATHYGFAEILGVEISPPLHELATANLARYAAPERICRNAHALLQDATSFPFPLVPLVVYLNHPFCRPVLEQVLENLRGSLARHPRPLWMVYINPETRSVLDRAPFLELVWEGTLSMAAEDRLADRMGSSQEEVAIYRGR
jgi:SAM-dependent methyltransferase